MIHLTINNQATEVKEGTTLLTAIANLGIRVPTLCHHKALTPYGACRLCVVEVEMPGRPSRVQASCSYPALEGMCVLTDTERIKRDRKIVAELLLARCPDSDVIRRVAAEQGVYETRITKKNDDCIYCGLCVRVCEERMGRSAIGFTGRGPKKKLEPPYGKHNDMCWACGACDFICPVGKKVRSSVTAIVPQPIPNPYNINLDGMSAVSIYYPQAIPNKPIIDEQYCLHKTHDACGICEAVCGSNAIAYDQQDRTETLEVGAIVLAPGFEVSDARLKKELGYGSSPNVIDALQFERILSPSGPYGGHVLRPSDQTVPKRLAFIQCVGSRDAEHDYCSSVCCMYATKEAIIAKEHAGADLQCDIYFMDIRAYSKGFEPYFESARKLGVNYIRCRVPTIQEVSDSRNLTITYLTEGDKKELKEYDLVVLSVGMNPPKNSESLARTFGIETNEFGFCKSSPFAPVESSREGIYAAGPFLEPKDIPESVVQSSGAAAKVMALLHDVRGSLIRPKPFPEEIDVRGQEPRVGVFVCHCGTNIAGVVNVAEVVEYTRTLPNVVYVESNLYTCSNDTQERISTVIAEQKLNRVVVASCTPRTHENLFRNTLREAGLNPYLFEMANIRDQCSWVHMHEPEKATRKASDLVRIAIAKARLNEQLYTHPLEVNHDALVIGGGVAGMTAALALAEQGFGVHLVERESTLGGYMKQVHYLLTEDHTQERVRDLVRRVEEHPNIHTYTNVELKEVGGSLGNFRSTVAVGGNGSTFEVNHGVIIVATGAETYKPTEHLYEKDPRVLLLGELEEQIASDRFHGQSVAFVQCVGSRNETRPYCSRTCCSETLKQALKLKERDPDVNVYVLYREMRAYGFRESYYSKARKLGVTFIRFADDAPPVVTGQNGKLAVTVRAETVDETVQLLVDNVVLAAATIPRESNKTLAQILRVPLGDDNFFLEAHRKLRPIDFATDGIFLCGNAHSPLGLDETISQAFGVAGRAGTILSKDQIDLEPIISHVVEENCDGCAYCIDPCPYKAIALIEYQENGEVKKRVEVNESLCKGCGTCMATCPKAAIFVWHFRPEMLSAEVKAALGTG